MNARVLVVTLACSLAVPLFARDKSDVLLMKNGDRITCEIKGLDGDTLYIKVDYILSTLSLNWSKVDHVESQQLFIVRTQDGLVYSGALATPETTGGRPIKIEVLEPPANSINAANKVELDKSQVIHMDETSSSFLQRFNGQIGMGIIYNKGNQSTQYSLSSDVNYPRERWAAGVSYDSTLSNSTGATASTRNEIDVNAQRLLRWNNWYYAGLGDFLQSSEQGIKLQSTIGGGVGRYLKNTSHAKVSLLGGLAWQGIDYQKGVVPATTQNVVSALISGEVKLFYFNKTNLAISSILLPAISEPGRVHFNLNVAYYVKLWSNLTWNISMYGNWDNRPPTGFSGSNYGSSSGLSWTFGNH